MTSVSSVTNPMCKIILTCSTSRTIEFALLLGQLNSSSYSLTLMIIYNVLII